jgi:hypothetical protein
MKTYKLPEIGALEDWIISIAIGLPESGTDIFATIPLNSNIQDLI